MRWSAGLWAALALGLSLCAPVAEAAGEPQFGFVWTTGVDAGAAGLRAEVSPNGLPTTYHFSYLPEAAHRANLSSGNDGFTGAAKAPAGPDPSIGSGTAAVVVAQSIGSLSPDTPYRFRVQATNGSGSSIGPSRVLTTTTFGTSTFLLDGRGWEMVSPVDKGGGEAQGPGRVFGGGVVQAAAGGSAFTYSSSYSFGADAAGAPAGSQYFARRGGGGWVTQNITMPSSGGAYGPEPDGTPFQIFSPDLARALLLDGHACDAGEPCPRGYSLRESASAVLTSSVEEPDLSFVGASADLGQRILSTCAALTVDAVEVPGLDGCDPALPNLYRWSGGGPSLVNLLPAASAGTPGASLAAQAGAVSVDGSRVYFTLGGNLYLREGEVSKQVDEAVGGGGRFETAAAAGSPAFYTAGGHLYRYDAPGAGTSTDLTPAGGVEGVLGASEDGGYVYYLTADGLFVRHGSAASLEIAAGADASNYPPAVGTARVSPDGTHLAFLSKQSLTGFDNRERNLASGAPGQPQTEVFLYDASTASLACVSCDPTGEQPLGSSTISGATANGSTAAATHSYKPRALSADGRRLFFDSADDLALRDRDRSPPRADPDVYEWEAQGNGNCLRDGGCIALVSGGRDTSGASFLDASASGADAFFLTGDSLVGADTGFADIYDAREGGGFPDPFKPIECIGDACQFLPSEPEDPQPSTLIPSPGNGPAHFSTPRQKHHKRKHHKKKHHKRKHHRPGKSGKRGTHR